MDIETGELLPGDIRAETRRIFGNLKTVLERYGSGMDQVVHCAIYLRDIRDWAAVTEEYAKQFTPETLPARICVGNVMLAAEVCSIEVSVIARR